MADNTGLFGDGMMGGYGNNITAANIIRSRVKQPLYQAAMENAEPNSSIRATPPTKFESWLNESGQRLMNPTDTIAQGVKDFTGQSDTELASSLLGGGGVGATVWHGSPHKFDKFDFSKIGTGEGAQAYGHGGYSAGNPNVAIQYQHMLSKPEFSVNAQGLTMRGDLPRMMDEAHGELISSHGVQQTQTSDVVDRVRERLDRQMQDALKANDMPWFSKVADMKMDLNRYLENPPPNTGYLYKIDLPDEHIAKMLDWDKPLSQQHPDVQNILAQYDKDTYHPSGADYDPSEMGQITYQRLSNSREPQVAASLLRDAGIPGIKYRDSGSRLNYTVQNFHKGTSYGEPVSFATDKQAKDYSAEQIQKGFETKVDPGTSNYVVFPGNEDMLTILERNNQPLVNALRSK